MRTPAWVDDLPDGWGVRKLKFIAAIRSSNVDKKSEEGEQPVRLCNYTDVYYNDRITAELDFMAATATGVEIERFRLRRGDVLITKDSESPDDIAVPAFVEQDFADVLCGYHLALIRPGPAVDGRFLACCIGAIPINLQFRAGANGIMRYGLSLDTIGSSRHPIPPIGEQHAIAELLARRTSVIDAIIRKKSRLIDVLHERMQTVTRHAVSGGLSAAATWETSGAESNRSIPAGWKVTRLRRIGTLVGGTGFPHEYQGREDEALPFFKVEDTNHPENRVYLTRATNTISESDARQLRAKPVKAGAIVFPKVGAALLGNKRRVVIRRSVFDNNLLAVVPYQASTKFLYYWFTTIDLGRLSNPGPVPSINESQVREISLALPPESEQVEIADRLDRLTAAVETAIAKLSEQIDRLREYRQTLVSAAVTGALDVRAPAATRATRREPALTT